jgi:hypothetical protein
VRISSADDRRRVQHGDRTLGALVLGVRCFGTVALVTTLGTYVPIIGAWTAWHRRVCIDARGRGHDLGDRDKLIIFAANGPSAGRS